MDIYTFDCPEETPESKYIPLDVMSDYSIGESIARIPDLVKKAKSLNMKSLALTDRTLSGVIEFYLLCKHNNIKPIIGQKIAFGNNEVNLLCKDFEAYKILCRHSLEFQKANDFPIAVTKLPLTKEECSHFICLTPYCDSELEFSFGGNLYRQVDLSNIKSHPEKLKKIETSNSVITNQIRYIEKEDFEALAAFKHSISKNPAPTYTDNYFADDSEIVSFLTENHHLEFAENTQEIAKQIQFIFPEDYFTTTESHKRMRENLPEFEDAENQLRALAVEGFKKKLHEFANEQEARGRLAYELEDINNHHWEKVFLFHHELTLWCHQNGIEVGPGRGSAPGSLVCYLLGITNVNPLKHGLIYERFLNPERLCYPDFDIDYDYERLPEVVNHLKEKYGEDKVVHIAAYGSLRRCFEALTIAAEYLDYPEDELKPIIDILRKLNYIWGTPRVNFSRLLDNHSTIYSTPCGNLDYNFSHWDSVRLQNFLRDRKNEKLIQIAKKLEGIKRNTGLHASGYVVTEQASCNYVPVLKDSRTGWNYSEYAIDSLEYTGLYKNDLLGLKQLTKLKQLSDEIAKNTKETFDYKAIPLEDKNTVEAFSKGSTTDVFQFEAPGMKKILKKFEPVGFSDLVLMNAMYRPGLIDYIPAIIETQKGYRNRYDFPGCQELLNESYGLPIYQEQIMQIVQKLADYSLAEGDMLRRALGKKKVEVLLAKKAEFIERAAAKGIVNDKQAEEIFEILLPYAGYAFNKSHAVAYTMMAYWEMYIKVHYPNVYKKVNKNFKEEFEREEY